MKWQDDGGRGDLTERQWQKLQPLLPPQKAHTGQPCYDHRRIRERYSLATSNWCAVEGYSRALWQTQHNFKSVLPMANPRAMAKDVGKSNATS